MQFPWSKDPYFALQSVTQVIFEKTGVATNCYAAICGEDPGIWMNPEQILLCILWEEAHLDHQGVKRYYMPRGGPSTNPPKD